MPEPKRSRGECWEFRDLNFTGAKIASWPKAENGNFFVFGDNFVSYAAQSVSILALFDALRRVALVGATNIRRFALHRQVPSDYGNGSTMTRM